MEVTELGTLLYNIKTAPKKWTGRDIPKEETSATLKEAWIAADAVIEALEVIHNNIFKKSSTPYHFEISDSITKCQDDVRELMDVIKKARG